MRYDTTQEQLEQVTSGILEVLNKDDRVDKDGIFVRITDFTDDSILIKINTYFKTTDYYEYLKISEDLILKIMGVLHTVGVQFALPGKSVFLENSNSEG